MDNFLYWYTNNNQNIIQVLAVLIGTLLVYLAYRVFFSPKSQTSGVIIPLKPSASSATYEATIKENHQSIDTASTEVVSEPAVPQEAVPSDVSSPVAMEPSPPSETAPETPEALEATQPAADTASAEIENLKKELEKMQLEAKSKTAELNAAKEQLVEMQKDVERNAKTTTRVMIDTSTLTGEQSLIDKIDELQKKLAEYDIIADDISELQNLRKENAELKEKVSATTT